MAMDEYNKKIKEQYKTIRVTSHKRIILTALM